MLKKVWIFFVSMLVLQVAFATPVEVIQDKQVSKRYQKLAKELRCPRCSNESIADSDALVTADLRLLIIKMIKDKSSDEQIKQYLVSRYGDYIIYKPRLQQNTFLLWFGPLIFFLIGIGILIAKVRKNTTIKIK
jgi:cytochrome c-type biogenesis protein CcmH